MLVSLPVDTKEKDHKDYTVDTKEKDHKGESEHALHLYWGAVTIG